MPKPLDIFSNSLRQTAIGKKIAQSIIVKKKDNNELYLEGNIPKTEPLSFAYQKLNEVLTN